MRALTVVLALLLTSAVSAEEVMDASYNMADGRRVLRHEILVPGSPDAVWQLFSTMAAIDLRAGGIWESSYAANGKLGDPANIRSEILSFIPGQMLSVRLANAPPGLPSPELARQLFTVIELVRINDPQTTRIRISMLPYGTGKEWDAVYDFFGEGHVVMLRRLAGRLGGRCGGGRLRILRRF